MSFEGSDSLVSWYFPVTELLAVVLLVVSGYHGKGILILTIIAKEFILKAQK